MTIDTINECDQCGICCKLFLINLNEIEYLSGKYKTLNNESVLDDFGLAKERGLIFLDRKEDGSCIYLENNSCSIHKTRPEVCREFFCTSKEPKFQGMIEEIRKAKNKNDK